MQSWCRTCVHVSIGDRAGNNAKATHICVGIHLILVHRYILVYVGMHLSLGCVLFYFLLQLCCNEVGCVLHHFPWGCSPRFEAPLIDVNHRINKAGEDLCSSCPADVRFDAKRSPLGNWIFSLKKRNLLALKGQKTGISGL